MALERSYEFMANLGLKSESRRVACGSGLFYYHKIYSDNLPILVLIHGYPQSAYMWRHIVAKLSGNVSFFIPDIPGYGRSTPSLAGGDKRTIGSAILEALGYHLGHTNRRIILVGHDRGARICHRLAVDYKDIVWPIIGTVLLDIVPTVVQFSSFADSANAAGTFHWPFLANVDMATKMISLYGGDKWCEENILRWAGKNEEGLKLLKSNEALEVYGEYFKNESIIRASCEDYRAGAAEDVAEQTADQKSDKKLEIDTLVAFSAKYLGSRYDVQKVWQEWHNDPSQLFVKPIGDGVGHFICEEAFKPVGELIAWFYTSRNVKTMGLKMNI